MEKKIEHSFEELWKLIEGTDIENKWYQVGKKGKVIDLQEQSHDLRSEHLKENRTSRESELVIFGDGITKYIIPENICKCDQQHAANLSKSGTNHLPRDNPEDTTKKICKLLVRIQYQFPNTVIFYSGILQKFGKKSFGDINYINESVFNLCARSKECTSSVITLLQ